MSKVFDSVIVNYPLATVRKLVVKYLRPFGSMVDNGNTLAVKDNTQRTGWSTSWPATVEITLSSSGEKTHIGFKSSNFGLGPIQTKECKSRLGAIKGAIVTEVDDYTDSLLQKTKSEQQFSSADEIIKYKQLMDNGVISQNEFDAKKKQLLGIFGGNTMKKEFEAFLIRKGYKQYTPSGNPSTVYDYVKRIDKVCEWEDITWRSMAENIKIILPQYDFGGIKEEFGHKSHNAVISALRCFAEFLSVQ